MFLKQCAGSITPHDVPLGKTEAGGDQGQGNFVNPGREQPSAFR